MDKLLRREFIMTVIFNIIFVAFVLQLVQCITVGFTGGIPEKESEDEPK